MVIFVVKETSVTHIPGFKEVIFSSKSFLALYGQVP